MPTEYVDDVSQLNLGEIPESVDYDAEYAPAQTQKALPEPGSYFIRLPGKIQFGKTPKGALQLILNGSKIEDAQKPDADGYELRFLDVNTSKVFDSNASSAVDLIKNFGLTDQPKTAEDWQNVARQIEGQVTPHPVYFTWQGYDKKAEGKAKYVKVTGFPTVEGIRQSKLERTDAVTGEKYTVFANLKPSARGFAPPKTT